MTLSQLQTSSGIFTIAPFDHRSSLSDTLGIHLSTAEGIAQFIELKRAFMEVFSPMCSAVLTDPQYGRSTLDAKDDRAGLLLSLEESGYEGGKAVVPPLLEDWGILGVKGYGAAAKLLLYFHPDEPNAAAKRALVADLYLEAQQHQVPFLLEPILYPIGDEQAFHQDWARLQQQVVEIFDDHCDVLKIEYPGTYAATPTEAASACQMISQAASKPWIILSKGMNFDDFVTALDISMLHGAAGFAAGRAVWQEIEQWSLHQTGNWRESITQMRHFLETTGVERMRQLIAMTS